MDKLKQKKIYFPIIFILSWLGFTIFTFSFGPYYYNVTNPFIFYSYLISIHLSLFLGYRRGLQSNGRRWKYNINYFSFVKTTIIISVGYSVVKLISSSGGNVLNVAATFEDAATSYKQSISGENVSMFSYIDMMFNPIYVIAVTNSIFSYKYLLKPYRFCLYFLIILPVFSSISSATRSGIVQIAIISMAAYLLGIYKKTIILKRFHKIILFPLVIFA